MDCSRERFLSIWLNFVSIKTEKSNSKVSFVGELQLQLGNFFASFSDNSRASDTQQAPRQFQWSPTSRAFEAPRFIALPAFEKEDQCMKGVKECSFFMGCGGDGEVLKD